MIENLEPRPLQVKALQNYLLYIKFNNGEEKIYDMKPHLNHKFYKNINDIENFKNIHISSINVEWETGEDIAPENLYNDSISINNFDKKDLLDF